jgi:magnesium chelatase subunit D
LSQTVYPFSAIVGQDELKLALTLNAIDPRIGGLLVRGEKGTAKSTAARALVSVLPKLPSADGCPFRCDPTDPLNLCSDCQDRIREKHELAIGWHRVPLVTLPLNVTEDMVAGGLDLEATLRSGRCAFLPGLLARANRGILYIDEVNLLDDHIVDMILDVASSGINLVEREGVSYWHPARFILIGTMNPEEGELRPHFLDRFGLCVQISGEADIASRAEVMLRREAYDTDPHAFVRTYRDQDAQVAVQITAARSALESIVFPKHLSSFVSEVCLLNNVAGHRADLAIRRAAAALAAWKGRWEVSAEDIERVTPMALLHRRRDATPELPPPPIEPRQDDARSRGDLFERSRDEPQDAVAEDADETLEPFSIGLHEQEDGSTGRGERERVFETGVPFKVRQIQHRKDRIIRRGSGRRSRTRTVRQGRYVKSLMRDQVDDVAFDATWRAAAPKQRYRRREPGMALSIRQEAPRQKFRARRVGNFILFIVDGSGSMGAPARMVATKGAILSLLIDAYQKRDRVAMITFRRQQARVSLQPTSSVDLALKQLQEMPVGGRTPLSQGLVEAFRLLRIHLFKEPAARPIAILITDGKANVAMGAELETADEPISPRLEALRVAARMAEEEEIKYVVVDTEEAGAASFGLAAQLAARLGADYFRIDDLKARDLVSIVTSRTASDLEDH